MTMERKDSIPVPKESNVKTVSYVVYECRRPDGQFGCDSKCSLRYVNGSAPSLYPTCIFGERMGACWLHDECSIMTDVEIKRFE